MKVKKSFLMISCLLGVVTAALITLVGIGSKFNGLWKFEAYGLLLQNRLGFVQVYQITASTVTRMKDYDGFILIDHLICGLGRLELSREGDTLKIIDKGSQTTYFAKKVGKEFLAGKKMVINDPRDQFLLFYEALKENYAFADLYQVDFDKYYRRFIGLIDKDTDDDILFQYMREMISGLNDDHVYLEREGRIYTPYKNPSLFWGDTAKVQELANLIKAKYLKDFKKFQDAPVCYGTLNDRIGYVVLTGMGTEALDQTRTTKKAFDQIITAFKDKKVLVIDLRFNNGGFDAASLLISGYFTKTPYLAYFKQAYYQGEYTEPQEIYVHPNALHYDGEIVLLISKYTVSAAETFAQALLANPDRRIRVVGEETKGFYSDCLPRRIKKNWYFGLSNERYLSVDGTAFEGTGIKPDVYIPTQYGDVQNGIDPVLEWVLNEWR